MTLLLTNFSPYNKWGSSFPRQADRVTLCGVKGKNLLQTNLMLPPIGQIILVHPPFFAPEMEVTESHLMGIVAEADSARFPYPIRLASNEELIQMLICPAEGN